MRGANATVRTSTRSWPERLPLRLAGARRLSVGGLLLFGEAGPGGLRQQQFPDLETVRASESLERGESQVRLSARLDRLIVFVRDLRSFSERLLREAAVRAQPAYAFKQLIQKVMSHGKA